jgi:hypothetical protein
VPLYVSSCCADSFTVAVISKKLKGIIFLKRSVIVADAFKKDDNLLPSITLI